MNRNRALIRTALLLIVVVPVLGVGVANANAFIGSDTSATTHRSEGELPPASEITVVTNHANSGGGNGTIAAFSQEKELLYRNSTYSRYFDVDPVPGEEYSVMYVGSTVLPDSYCKLTETDDASCVRNVVERLNISTGETERLYTYEVVSRHPEDSVHDVDRVGEDRLLVADIFRNRAFIVNTTSGLITWQWHARMDFSYGESGGPSDDWTHINDVEYIEERDQVMVDLRNHDLVAFIDIEQGLDENYTLGGDDNYEILYEQHNPDYIPTNQGGPAVLVADSENNRIVEYQRSEGEWNRSWIYSDAEMEWPRDADRLPNGNTLITDTHSSRVFEVNESGDVVWKLNFPKGYEAERLGTGDESAGGSSASQLGLTSISGEEAESSGGWTFVDRVNYVLRLIIPNKIYHGLLVVSPSWVGLIDLAAMFGSVIGFMTWSAIEIRWSEKIKIRSPVQLQ